jgi:hypothetical protein
MMIMDMEDMMNMEVLMDKMTTLDDMDMMLMQDDDIEKTIIDMIHMLDTIKMVSFFYKIFDFKYLAHIILVC